MTQTDKFNDDEDGFWLIFLIIFVIVSIVSISFLRRKIIAPKVCVPLCSVVGERYSAWELTNFGINCLCKPHKREQNPNRSINQ